MVSTVGLLGLMIGSDAGACGVGLGWSSFKRCCPIIGMMVTEKTGRHVNFVAWSAIGEFSLGLLVHVMDGRARAIWLKSVTPLGEFPNISIID